MLKLDHLVSGFDDFRLTADLAIPPGARVAIIGASGSGKSTLLSLLAGFLVPDSGRILWGDRDLTGLPPGQRPMTMLFQDQNLFPHLTTFQNVALGLRPDLRLTPAQHDAVMAALSGVGLGSYAQRYPAQLSGGQQSRVALARAMLRARPILLLDEPFAALGPALKDEMLDLLDKMARAAGTTVLMVTHDPADARRLAPLTVLVDNGRVFAPVPTAQVLDNPPPALAAYLGARG